MPANARTSLCCRKPTPDQITKRAAVICKAEGLAVNDTTLNTVAAGANGDIRLVLGQLQMIRLRSKTLSYDDAKVPILSSPLWQFLCPVHGCAHTQCLVVDTTLVGACLEVVDQESKISQHSSMKLQIAVQHLLMGFVKDVSRLCRRSRSSWFM